MSQKVEVFHRLHEAGCFVMPNPWDVGSATALERMGFEVEASHHEVAHGQHEIDFRYADALKTADNIATFRFVVKYVALARLSLSF